MHFSLLTNCLYVKPDDDLCIESKRIA